VRVLLLTAALTLACTSKVDERPSRTAAPLTKNLPRMHAARRQPAATRLADGRVLVAGGEDPTPAAVSTAEIFDPKTSSWTAIAPMKEGRAGATATRFGDGRVLVAGGDADTTLSTAEMYDTAKGTWTTVAPMRSARYEHGAVLLGDGTALHIGGRNADAPELVEAETYDPATDTWSSVGAMAVARQAFASVLLADGRVLVVGDSDMPVEIYDPATKTFHAGKGAVAKHYDLAAVRLADGRVLVSGGTTDTPTPTEVAYLFDPTTETLTATTPMPATRFGHSLTLLPSGLVLAFGGETTGKMLFFDPATSSWNDAGFATTPRSYHAAVPLGDGSVLLAGGSVDPLGYAGDTDTAELFVAAAEGSACKSDGECLSYSCVSGKCSAPGSVVAPPPPSTTLTGTFTRCDKDAACPSGHCVDGVCCDTACTERCHSCVLPSAPGVCTPEPVGVDLRGECGAQATCSGTCGPSGACIGSTAGSLCARSACTSATTGRGPAVCTAPGAACPKETAIPFDCGPYTCEPAFGACRSNCSSSSDCAGGFVCSEQKCIAPTQEGDPGGCAVQPRARPSIALFAMAMAAALAVTRRRRP
jgi:MYXO-CTERM domain-containing protein